MSYDDKLAARVDKWAAKRGNIERKVMFGGLCYLIGGHMIGGVKDANLILRLGPAGDVHLGKPNILPFPTWSKPMSGFLQVEPPGTKTDAQLAKWLDEAHRFAAALPPKTAKPKNKAR